MENKLKVLEEILEGFEISDFTRDWILNSNTNEDSIRIVYRFLKEHGIKDKKIASNAQLLGMNPETINKNYQHHISLLRQDYKDRNSGRDLLTNQAQLLGIPNKTIESNVQYLHSLGIDYYNGFLLGTKTQNKKNKLAWMLRELFNYRDISKENKKEVINLLYEFIRNNPNLLIKSINSLRRNKDRSIENIMNYSK